MEKEITNIKLDKNPILEKDIANDKIGILDIRAEIDEYIDCNIEMQIVDRKNIEKRLLFYWSKMYVQNIKQGQNYEKLKKTIVILFIDYELESLKELEKYKTKWNLREEENSQIVLTDVLELYIIEMPKAKEKEKKGKKQELDLWVEFIESPEEFDMEKANKEIKEAKEKLEEISRDEREQELAFQREIYIMDQKAIEDGGFDKGVESATLNIAKKMKKQKLAIEIISEVTGLTKEVIEKL